MLELLLGYQAVIQPLTDNFLIVQTIVSEIAQFSTQADYLTQEGNRLHQEGQFDAAIAAWQQALHIYKAQGKTNEAAFVLGRIGSAYADEAQFQQAIESYQEALELRPNLSLRAALLGSIGSAHRSLGNYQTSIAYQLEALSIYQSSVNHPLKHSKVLGNLGNTYAVLGSYKTAEDYLRQSLEIASTVETDRTTARDQHIATVFSNLGNLQLEQRNYATALDYYQQSLANQTEHQDSALRTLMEIGGIHHLEKRYEQAIQIWQEGLEQAQAINNTALVAEFMARLGSAHAAIQNYSQAFQSFEAAISNFQVIGLQREIATTLNNRAHAYLTQAGETGNTEPGHHLLQQAEADLKKSITILDNLRQPLPDDTARIALFDTQISTYNLLQQVQVKQRRFETALVTSEQGRARASLALLTDRLGIDSTQFSIERLKGIAKNRNATIVEYTLIPDDRFVHMGRQQGTVAEIYIWIIKPSGEIYFEQIDLRDRNTTFTHLIQGSRASIGLRSRAGIQVNYTGPPQTEQLHQLYQYLIAPIARQLPDNPDEEVIFIPQGQLFLVPFAALPIAPEKDSSYLIDQHTISVASSMQMLVLNRQQRGSNVSSWTADDFLIVGNPVMPKVWVPFQAETVSLDDLPNAQVEAENIANLFGTQAYTQAEATESRVKQLLEDKTVLHFATHGLLDYEKPGTFSMRSNPGAIALAPGQGEDGLLTSTEIFETSLKADLVVLSACDTGLGDITGDGVVGLSRSFMAAGAPSIVISLWSVPDAPTANLMTAFYEALQQGHHKTQALRQAMLKTKQIYPTPKNWAAFMLIGETQ